MSLQHIRTNIGHEFPNDLKAQTLRLKEAFGETLSVVEAAELRARKLMPGCSGPITELLVKHSLGITTQDEHKELMRVVTGLAERICPTSSHAQSIKCKQILGETITEEESAVVESTQLYPTSVVARELYILRRMGRASKEQIKLLAAFPDSASEE